MLPFGSDTWKGRAKKYILFFLFFARFIFLHDVTRLV
jgi:hypothetical protein